jgi:hypothetical protein
MREVHINKGRVGEDRGSKEMDGCPLTVSSNYTSRFANPFVPSTAPSPSPQVAYFLEPP